MSFFCTQLAPLGVRSMGNGWQPLESVSITGNALSSSAVGTSGVRSRFADCRLPGTLIDLRAGLEDFALCPGAAYTHTRRVGWGSASPVLGELEIDAVKPCSLRPNRKVFFLSKANSIGSNMKRRWKPTLLACRTASRNIGESVASPPAAGYCFCSRQLLMCPHARWISSALVVSSGGSSKAWLLRHP